MITYLLLAQPASGSSSPSYRGTYRPGPVYISELDEDVPVNQLWTKQTGPMPNENFTRLEEAIRIQAIYAEAGFELDLVMIMDPQEMPLINIFPQFIGYDISHPSGYSLLSWDLNFSAPAPEFFHQRDQPIYQPLLLLIEKYFRPLLNFYRLFQSAEDAQFFLRVATTMTTGFGAVWENPEYEPFTLTKMYILPNYKTSASYTREKPDMEPS